MESMEILKAAHHRSLNSIHLIASEAWIPEYERIPYLLDIYSRYVYDKDENIRLDKNGLSGQLPDFVGTEELQFLEERCNLLLCQYLGVKYSSVKPISGLNMILCVLGSLVMKNELVLSLPISAGGHSATKYLAERLGIIHQFIPIVEGGFDIDEKKLGEIAKKSVIKMIYIDLMNVVSPINIQLIRNIVGRKTIICYDASHILGLLIGGKFQVPIIEGADIIVGSTHKTFPGPHKGIFATNSRWLYMLFKINHVLFISHTHIADTATLALMLEKGSDFYAAYASDVITNVEVMSKELKRKGLEIISDKSHQIWVDMGEKDALYYANECIRQGIYVNVITIPHNGHNGIRIGIQEITFQGYMDKSVIILSRILAKIFSDHPLSNIDLLELDKLKKRRKEKSKENINGLIKQLTQIYITGEMN